MFPGVTLLDHTFVLSSISSVICKLIPTMAVLIYILLYTPKFYEGSFLWDETRFQSSFSFVFSWRHFWDPEQFLQYLLTICLFVFQSVFSVHFPICLAVLFPCIDSLLLCRCLCALLTISADFFFMVSHLLILRSVPMLLLFFLINMSLPIPMSSWIFPMFSKYLCFWF